MTRQMLGGSADATQADPELSASHSGDLRAMFELMHSDHDSAQGAGHWKTVVAQTFDRITQPHGYTFDDMHAITAPTLILIGDRDPFCTVEEGAAAYRALQAGELAVLPDTGHLITPPPCRPQSSSLSAFDPQGTSEHQDQAFDEPDCVPAAYRPDGSGPSGAGDPRRGVRVA